MTVSYFEWVQNIEHECWDLPEVEAQLKAKMESATDAVIDTQERIERETGARVDLRTAAFALAVGRGIWS